MKQKIIKIGNSAGVILPQVVQNEVGLKLSDSVIVSTLDQSILITPIKEKKTDEELDPKFVKMVDEFITDHEDVLKELANR